MEKKKLMIDRKAIFFVLLMSLYISTGQATIITACAVGCNYTTIQAAINGANNTGDTIEAKDTIMNEQLTINKEIILWGNRTGGDGRPILNFGGYPSINITADNVTVKNFQILGSAYSIEVNANNSIIRDNVFSQTAYAVTIVYGSNNYIYNNTMRVEIAALENAGDNTTLISNYIEPNLPGTDFPFGLYNYGTNTKILYNYQNGGSRLGDLTADDPAMIVDGNTINGTYYGIVYNSNTGGIVRNNIVINTLSYAFRMYFSTNTLTENNTFDVLPYGLEIEGSTNNTIRGNRFQNVSNEIFYIYETTYDNWIYDNIFNSSTYFVYDTIETKNYWNLTSLSVAWNVKGRLYKGGNYWAYPNGSGYSQTCSDPEGWGRCAGYVIDGNNTDAFPISTTTYRYITVGAEVREVSPNTNFDAGTTAMTDWQNWGNEYRFFIGINPNITANGGYVMIKAESTAAPYYLLMVNTTEFNESNITWNNQPGLSTTYSQIHNPSAGVFLPFYYPAGARYMAFWEGISQFNVGYADVYTDDAINITDRPYLEMIVGAYSPPSLTYNATGNVQFQDTDGSYYNLQNATVKYNESVYTFTDAFGDYSITLPADQISTLTVSYNDAMNTATGTVEEGDPVQDFTLLYSKGTLSAPVLDGNKIKTTYSNNIATVNLWEFPSFVWGAVRYDKFINTSNDVIYYYAAQSLGGSVFGLNVEYGKGGYTVYFVSSDFYNYPTTGWNPEVSAYRFFNSTSYYYDELNEELSGRTSNKTQSVREAELKDEAELVIPFLMFIILLLAFATKIKERRF